LSLISGRDHLTHDSKRQVVGHMSGQDSTCSALALVLTSRCPRHRRQPSSTTVAPADACEAAGRHRKRRYDHAWVDTKRHDDQRGPQRQALAGTHDPRSHRRAPKSANRGCSPTDNTLVTSRWRSRHGARLRALAALPYTDPCSGWYRLGPASATRGGLYIVDLFGYPHLLCWQDYAQRLAESALSDTQ